MTGIANPFRLDPDRSAIWTMLVERDIDAFLAADWSRVEGDFLADGFLGIDAGKEPNPDSWVIGFPTLDAYRDEWLRQAAATAAADYDEDVKTAVHRATTLSLIDIAGGSAVAHKKFDGSIRKRDGTEDVLHWQTLYFCRRVGVAWKLTGFIGYMPVALGAPDGADAGRPTSALFVQAGTSERPASGSTKRTPPN